jgi:Leucine-rich repeat (LRR) protein
LEELALEFAATDLALLIMRLFGDSVVISAVPDPNTSMIQRGTKNIMYPAAKRIAGKLCDLPTLHSRIFVSSPQKLLPVVQLHISRTENCPVELGGQNSEVFLANPHMSNLKAIQQNGRGLTSVPDWILQTSSLTRLSLRKNRIALLSRDVCQYPLLKCLDLSENELVALPPEIGLLTALQSLLLAFNHLSILPRTFGLCVNIESLDLKGNKLTNVPFFFTRFVRLTRLDFTNNVLQVCVLYDFDAVISSFL